MNRQSDAVRGLGAEAAVGLLDKLRWRAVHQKDRTAYRFLSDQSLSDQSLSISCCDSTTWTYGDLYGRVQTIANELYRSEKLSQNEALIGQTVLLVYPPGLELIAAFLGCLSVGAIPTLVPPPRRHESLSRWQHIMADATVAGVLTTQGLSNDVDRLVSAFLKGSKGKEYREKTIADSLYQLATDTVETTTGLPQCLSNHSSSEELAEIDFTDRESFSASFSPDKVAFLQYTSGSTSQPKGVIVTHGNVAHNLQQIQVAFGHSADTRCVIWLPPYHDMGLIGGILQPLYGGYPVTLMSPTAFLQRPVRWLETISHFGGTTSGGPNFAYDYCVQKISAERCQSLDLSSWSVAFTGAEPVQAETLRRFSEKFSSYGFQKKSFYPCYGLAESTLFVTGGAVDSSPKVVSVNQSGLAKEVVSCGQSSCQHVEIVAPQTQVPCQPGQVGEIWVAGESVAAGYWNQAEETQSTFGHKLEGCSHSFLRTGDLGFMQSGELFITGRLKDLIVVRGQNYYPQDIELSASQAHKALQSASAAFSLSSEEIASAFPEQLSKLAHGQEQTVIVQELSRSAVRKIRQQALSAAEVVEAIRSGISQQHGLQVWDVVLIKPGHLPKTTSGKVKRQACKHQFLAGTLSGTLDVVASSQKFDQKEANTEQEATRKTQQILDWLRDYAKDFINSRLMDERRCLSPSVVLDFGNQGLLGMQVPKQYDGLGLNNQSMLRVIEQLGAIDTTLALFVGLNNVLGIRPILNYADRDLKEQLLPKLATGRELAAFALTESIAGSHPFGIKTQAIPVNNAGESAIESTCWQLQGEKIWSGSAAWAGVTTVFAQQVDGSGAPIGISAFAVRKGAPGLKQGPEALTMGMRGMVQNTVLLENVPVGVAQRLGTAGEGMAVAQDAMMYGRLAIASACVGGMKRCAQLMVRYSKRRNISTGRLLDNPVIVTRLSWLTNAIAATESLVTLAAKRLDSNLSVPEEIYAACKIAAPEFYWQAADYLVQCLGGRGYIETNIAPQILRDARVLRIFEGPTEALSMYLGSRVLNQPDALRDFFEQLSLIEIGELLFESSRWVLERYTGEKSPILDELTARRQVQFVVGEVATWAILLAALKASPAAEPEGVSVSTIEWAQKQFDDRVKQALEDQPDEAFSLFATLEAIEQYQQNIGEVEQTAPGTNESVDTLLKIEERESFEFAAFTRPLSNASGDGSTKQQARNSSEVVKRAAAYSYSSRATKREDTIKQWMVRWLSQQLKVDSSKINVNKAFADYGLDSVMAVELAQDLSDFFKLTEPLETTLAWNFPTIQSLANHLAIMLSQQEIERSEVATEGSATGSNGSEIERDRAGDDVSLNNLSEAEAANALAAELGLATVRRH